MQCHGTTVTGKHCKLKASAGKEYCPKHMYSTIVVSVQCSSINRDGNRCKHMTTRSTRCWQHLLKEEKLRIKKSPISGLGLFTTAAIPRGVNVAPYTGDLVVTRDSRFGGDHVLQVKRHTFIDARRSNTGEGRYANARLGARNNAQLVYNARAKKASVKAVQTIPANTEVTVPYGAAYWAAQRARR